jgi:hypothetical protein
LTICAKGLIATRRCARFPNKVCREMREMSVLAAHSVS